MTRILSLETTEMYGSVAVLDESGLLLERQLEERSARALAPMIGEMLKSVGWAGYDVQAVAVGIGPGSFTGLRVGVATAKMFAYATNARIIGVPTLLALAESVGPTGKIVDAAMDAQRGDVVAQRFEVQEGEGRGAVAIENSRLISLQDWFSDAEKDNILYTGPVLHRIHDQIPQSAQLAESSLWNPRASVIGQIANRRLQNGDSDDLWTLLPIYARISAAEERRGK